MDGVIGERLAESYGAAVGHEMNGAAAFAQGIGKRRGWK
jgi:hypothetical protein